VAASAPLPLTVGARVDKLYFYPCSDCHAYMDPNDKERELDVQEGHPAKIEHGNDEFWCTACHNLADFDHLRTFRGQPVDFDKGYEVCGTCHAQKFRDWTRGAHGKRVANWRGERQLYSCVECHNPHHPAIAPRAPDPPPPIRAGLKPMAPTEIEEAHNPRMPEGG